MNKKILFSSGTTTSSVDLVALLLRLVGGIAMIYGHGWSKFMKFFNESNIQFMDPFGLGDGFTFFLVVFAEFICAVLLTVGLFSRVAVIPLILNMVYAVFVFHISDGFGKWELGALYLCIYVAILLLGPGKFSMDRLIESRNRTI